VASVRKSLPARPLALLQTCCGGLVLVQCEARCASAGAVHFCLGSDGTMGDCFVVRCKTLSLMTTDTSPLESQKSGVGEARKDVHGACRTASCATLTRTALLLLAPLLVEGG
jgi:hypothetical protein